MQVGVSEQERIALAWAQSAPRALRRLVEDLNVWCDMHLACGEMQTWASADSVAGQEAVHVAFRFEVIEGGLAAEGAWLLPWKSAALLVAWMERADAKRMGQLRASSAPDATAKQTLIELDGIVAAAVEGALAELGLNEVATLPGGCQGVGAGRRPALKMQQQPTLWVCRDHWEWIPGEAFETALMLPELRPQASSRAA